MKILLVYPRYPDTFWSFRYALKFARKAASFPPLGLLTIAAMLPVDWQKKLVDMNVTGLSDKDIAWADYVFISAMEVQKESAQDVIARCNRLKVKVVAGGPLFTTGYDTISGVDHFVLNEAEITLPQFLADVERGSPQHLYTSEERPDVSLTPIPMWSLLDMKKYSSMNVQYSRGCPFDCEFCDIIILNGRRPRTKSGEQFLAELDELYRLGWRSGLFIVDDNFIGNKLKVKAEILPALIEWQKRRKYPFALSTEASINLADDEELMDMMALAGFNTVFIGIESPNEESLQECNKLPNKGRDLVSEVKKIQRHGLEVQGGFIVGFDHDPVSIFRSQINFIQKSGIVTAMVGILNAPRGTRLYKRLMKENRLLNAFTGDNTDASINFIPRMNYHALLDGYKTIVSTIYSPAQYYERIKTFLGEYRPMRRKGQRLRLTSAHIHGFFRSIWFLGITGKERKYYWRLFFSTLFRHPRSLPITLSLAVYGFHFRKIIEKYLKMPMGDASSNAQ